jgi:hypothetical protein
MAVGQFIFFKLFQRFKLVTLMAKDCTTRTYQSLIVSANYLQYFVMSQANLLLIL